MYVFSQPCSFSWKGDHHFEENSRKEEGRTCGSKAEVSVFDFNKPELRATLFFWSGCFRHPGIIRWIRGLLKEPQETASGTSEACSQVLKGDNQSQRGCGKLQRDNVQGNMHGKLQRKIEIQLQTTRLASHRLQIRWESLHESSSKIESNGGWWYVWPEDQRIDLVTIYVDND